MKSFRSFIAEARRNPEQNVKQFPVQALEKYKDNDDIFITFITNAKDFTETGKDDYNAAQVGLNTKSRYNTPNGIYTYPMVEVYQHYVPGKGWKRFNVPFAGHMPKIAVLQRKGKNYIDDVGSGEYSNAKLAGDTEKIAKYTTQKLMKILNVKNEHLIFLIVCATIRYAFTRASNDLPGMQFWNASRLCSALIALGHEKKSLTSNVTAGEKGAYQRNFRIGEDMPKMSAWWIYGSKEDVEQNYDPDKPQKVPAELLSKVFTKVQKMKGDKSEMTAAHIFEPSGDKKEKGKTNPYANAWAVLLANIGYDSIADRSGKRVIHPAEPIQAVFLARRGYKVLEIIENKTYEDKKPAIVKYEQEKTDEGKAKFLQKVEKGEILQGQESVSLWRFFEKLRNRSIIVNGKVLKILAKLEPHTPRDFYRTGHTKQVINDCMQIALKEKADNLTVFLSKGPETQITPETIIFGINELLRQKTDPDPKSINSPLVDIRQSIRLYENKWNKQDENVIQAFRAAKQKKSEEALEFVNSQKAS